VIHAVPKSRSKRSSYIPPKPARPKASPRWVPGVGLGLIALGIVLILVNYIFQSLLPIGNYSLILGFVLMAGGLAVLSQWR
jgi:predicted acyltransferase